ncbi:Uncharacterized protein dnm_063830 [Desulfonema magnum]|uniref:Uncharacterized protein n=1 Tax=Desulfonema magnum TaxID=45655 RepID=A0A975BRE8_9BACT|nr:Uncharacterized protein dnm_063830 [Desulfonema magnum]
MGQLFICYTQFTINGHQIRTFFNFFVILNRVFNLAELQGSFSGR